MAIYFEWDDPKSARNLRIHGIDFEEARSFLTTLFESPNPIPL
jgi:uncharacterized DUF497 family protein